MIEKGTIIAVGGELYEYDYKGDKYHIAYEILIDEDGHLIPTYTPFAFTDKELQDNAVNFTETQWCGIVKHFIRQNYDLSDRDIHNAAVDIVGRCFAYGIPTIEELPEYIAEYLNR